MKLITVFLLISLFANFPGCEREDPLLKDEVEGTVVDYTGLDGCGLIIELDNGEKLEPVEIAVNFVLIAGQRVALTYTELTEVGSICMVGKIVRIETIRELDKCKALTDFGSKLPNDSFSLDTLHIEGDCLVLDVQYGGGCKEHEFLLCSLPTMKSTSKGMLPVLTLCHDNNGDMCEAWISRSVSFDLSELKNPGAHQTQFILVLNYEGSDYSEIINYYY